LRDFTTSAAVSASEITATAARNATGNTSEFPQRRDTRILAFGPFLAITVATDSVIARLVQFAATLTAESFQRGQFEFNSSA
jgi:hypothetical protein